MFFFSSLVFLCLLRPFPDTTKKIWRLQMRRRCFFIGVCMWGDVRWREEVLWEKLFKICIDLVPIFSSMKVVGFWYKVCRLIDLILLFYLYSHKCRQHSFILFVSVDVQSSWLVFFLFFRVYVHKNAFRKMWDYYFQISWIDVVKCVWFSVFFSSIWILFTDWNQTFKI